MHRYGRADAQILCSRCPEAMRGPVGFCSDAAAKSLDRSAALGRSARYAGAQRRVKLQDCRCRWAVKARSGGVGTSAARTASVIASSDILYNAVGEAHVGHVIDIFPCGATCGAAGGPRAGSRRHQIHLPWLSVMPTNSSSPPQRSHFGGLRRLTTGGVIWLAK